jgi:3-dehydroquinate synthase
VDKKNNISIQSFKGIYSVFFDEVLFDNLSTVCSDSCFYIIDANVANRFTQELSFALNQPQVVIIDALESSKSIQNILPIFQMLIEMGIRRNHTLVAIGGGIIQDITCFIASILLRGLKWRFIPTTLLSQADSCIGSKSSINLGNIKNILGTFNPPDEIFICRKFLSTLEPKDIMSGIGEMIKVHAIDSAQSFDLISGDYEKLKVDSKVLEEYIYRSLLIKKGYIEIDEFDKNIRNIFNYGHSFGHAIEAATNFAIPHGIAVTMGMEMSNNIAQLRGILPRTHYDRMKPLLKKNFSSFKTVPIELHAFLLALAKDKKNTPDKLGLIFPEGNEALIRRHEIFLDDAFKEQCSISLCEIAA